MPAYARAELKLIQLNAARVSFEIVKKNHKNTRIHTDNGIVAATQFSFKLSMILMKGTKQSNNKCTVCSGETKQKRKANLINLHGEKDKMSVQMKKSKSFFFFFKTYFDRPTVQTNTYPFVFRIFKKKKKETILLAPVYMKTINKNRMFHADCYGKENLACKNSRFDGLILNL